MQLKLENKTLKKRVEATLSAEPTDSAEIIGLRYVRDDIPGIKRQRSGKKFCYIDVDGNKICEQAKIDRIQQLRIPPAWTDVWICPYPHGHLQATGRDRKGRKQYRYHPKWRKIRSQTKFNRMIAFGQALPKIRQQVSSDLAKRGLPKEKVLALVVRLLEVTKIRVGNQQYAQSNKSFGLTTMRDRHVDISGAKVRFKFRGKSGVEHDIKLNDRRLAAIVKKCREIPGYELFQYFDDDDNRQIIESGDVNDYLRVIAGLDFTAKDFRTWFGTVLAAEELCEIGEFESEKQAKKNVNQAIKYVSRELGNRPATCRKYYIHPAIIEAYIEGSLLNRIKQISEYQSKKDTKQDNFTSVFEQAVLKIVEQNLFEQI